MRKTFSTITVLVMINLLMPNLTSPLISTVGADEVEFEEAQLFGSDGSDFGMGISIDSEDNFIIVGHTNYPIFYTDFSGPGTFYDGPFFDRDHDIFDEFPLVDALDPVYNGNSDLTITKFSKTNNIIWSTYLGGTKNDIAADVVNDIDDNVILVGSSSSVDFPVSSHFNSSLGGTSEGIIVKLTADSEIIWSRFLGGSGNDVINAVSIDKNQNIIVIGRTVSTDFPVVMGYQDEYIGEENGGMTTITKLSPDGEIIWSTYFGGSIYDSGGDIVLGSDNTIYITGWTRSPDLPLIDSFDRIHNGKQDGYVAKFSEDGQLLWSSLLGGSLTDIALGIAVDGNDSLIVTGYTMSSGFPLLNAADEVLNRGFDDGIISDAFLTKFSADGDLIFSQYLGGRASDQGDGLVVDDSGNIFLIGSTQSGDFPIYADFDSTPPFNQGNNEFTVASDIFLTKLSPIGEIMFSIYFGGERSDRPSEILLNSENEVLVTGFTDSQFSFGPIEQPPALALTNMHFSRLFIPDGFFPFVPYEQLEDTDTLTRQPLFQAIVVVLLFLFSGTMLGYLKRKRRERKMDEIATDEYNNLHQRIADMFGEESSPTDNNSIPKVQSIKQN